MGESTLRSIVIFPAEDRCRFDQLFAFCWIRSTIDVNKSRFFLPNSSGRPTYLPVPPSFWILKVSLIVCFREAGVHREKVIADFSGLINCPEAASYLWRIRCKASLLFCKLWWKTSCRPQRGDDWAEDSLGLHRFLLENPPLVLCYINPREPHYTKWRCMVRRDLLDGYLY